NAEDGVLRHRLVRCGVHSSECLPVGNLALSGNEDDHAGSLAFVHGTLEPAFSHARVSGLTIPRPLALPAATRPLWPHRTPCNRTERGTQRFSRDTPGHEDRTLLACPG